MLPAVHEIDIAIVRSLLEYGQDNTWFALLGYFLAQELILVIVVAVYVLWRYPEPVSHRHGNQKAVVLALLTTVMALALKTLIASVLYRARPYISHPDLFVFPMVRVDPPSFPSAHTLVAFALAGSLWFSGIKKLGGGLLLIATLVAFGRVAVGVHYPSDVIGGAVIALATAWFLHRESSSIKQYLPN